MGSRFSEKLFRADLLVFGGAILCALAIFLPWAHLGMFSVKVYDTDALWACLAALGGVVWAAVDFKNSRLSRGACVTALVCGAIALLITILGLANLASAGDDVGDDPFGFGEMMAEATGPSVGLFAILLGSAAITVGCIGVLAQKPGLPANWFMKPFAARTEG